MTRILVACVLSVVCIAPTLAQSQVDFSGSWTRDDQRSGSASTESSVSPVVWVIQQTADRLILERKQGAAPFTYTITAKPVTKADASIKSPTADAPGYVGYWDGDRLILETHQTIQGKTVTAREVLTLTSADQMTVERVVEVEHGYTMKGAKNSSSAKDVFTRRK
jgi:hypothetical protein